MERVVMPRDKNSRKYGRKTLGATAKTSGVVSINKLVNWIGSSSPIAVNVYISIKIGVNLSQSNKTVQKLTPIQNKTLPSF